MATKEKFLSVDEVADRLGVQPRFVRRLIGERRIEFRKFGRLVRISEKILDDYMEQGRVPALPRHEFPWQVA